MIEESIDRRAIVTAGAEAGKFIAGALAGQRVNGGVGIHPAHSMIKCVADEDISRRIDADARGMLKTSGNCWFFVAAKLNTVRRIPAEQRAIPSRTRGFRLPH